MKNLIISLLLLCGIAHAASVYVDVTDKAGSNDLYLAPASTDTITFYVATNGSAFAADSYTPILYMAPNTRYSPDSTKTITGTASGAAASFAATNVSVHAGMDGWDYQLVFRSGAAPAYRYSYPVNGKLRVSNTPKATTGDVLVQAGFGAIKVAQAAVSLTNGATLTPVYGTYIVSGIGGEDDTTNTVTLANAVDGQSLTLIVSATSSNLITIADSGNAALSSAWLGDNNDVITLRGVSTNWVEVSASDN